MDRLICLHQPNTRANLLQLTRFGFGARLIIDSTRGYLQIYHIILSSQDEDVSWDDKQDKDTRVSAQTEDD